MAGTDIDSALDLRRRGMEAPNREAARAEARAWQKEQASDVDWARSARVPSSSTPTTDSRVAVRILGSGSLRFGGLGTPDTTLPVCTCLPCRAPARTAEWQQGCAPC